MTGKINDIRKSIKQKSIIQTIEEKLLKWYGAFVENISGLIVEKSVGIQNSSEKKRGMTK